MPGRRVICISRARGALGEEVGELVAKRLGLRYVDEEIVARAAARENVDPDLIADAERRKSLVTRILESFALGGAPGYVTPHELLETDHYRELIRDTLVETARQGNCVIVAHAASFALPPGSEVLRVLVTASPELRARRLAEAGATGDEEPAKVVRQSDENRADYLRRFYDVDEELPTHYDVVVNTDTLTAEQAAEIVATAAGE
jgi:hypothetical protein